MTVQEEEAMKFLRTKCLGMECGYCITQCAAYRLLPLESSTSRGKARLLDALLKKRISLEEIVRVAYFCTRCGYCQEVCVEGEGAEEFIIHLREEIVKKGIEPEDVRKKAEELKREGGPYPERNKDILLEFATKRDLKSKIAYFPGCNILANKPELAKKTYLLLHEIGIWAKPVTEFCCGSPLLNTGYIEDWKRLAWDFLSYLKKMGIKEMILSCGGGCLRMLRKDYLKYLGWSIPALHITEVLYRHGSVKKGHLNTEKSERVIYHDSCVMGRTVKIHKEPRALLSLSGFEVAEFERSKEETLCCGGGGGLSTLWQEESKQLSKEKVEEAFKKSAHYLATSCPTCLLRLEDAVKEKGRDLKVVDVVELLM